MPMASSTLPDHLLIQRESPATKLNGFSCMRGWGGVSQPKPFVYMSTAPCHVAAPHEKGEVDLG